MATEGESRLFDFLKGQKQDFQLAWSNQPASERMLAALGKFCNANKTPTAYGKDGRVDAEQTYINLGRQEVWLFIQQHLNLTTQQLYRLYTGREFNPGDTDV